MALNVFEYNAFYSAWFKPAVCAERKSKAQYSYNFLSGAVLSVIVELVQLIFAIGKFEFNDMIMNTLGTALGTLSFLLVSLILRKANER